MAGISLFASLFRKVALPEESLTGYEFFPRLGHCIRCLPGFGFQGAQGEWDQQLPVEFAGELQAARRIGGRNCSKRSVAQVGIGFKEVWMVEGIEQLKTELNALGFR
jgi:hypothetical protein